MAFFITIEESHDAKEGRILNSILHIFPLEFRRHFVPEQMEQRQVEEIRIRVGQPMIFRGGLREYYLDCRNYDLTETITDGYVVKEEDLAEMVAYLSRYSLYAFEEELKNGYITIEGGHRIGIGGQVSVQNGEVAGINYICFLNIRIAREVKGCAASAIPYLLEGSRICNALILSPPGIGKTTFLRDCVRLLSDGEVTSRGYRICVVDERSEIAAAHRGIPQNDVGSRTDVLDRCPKNPGMVMALRAMNPEIIAVDELGTARDYEAVRQVMYCGCKILGTMHARDIEELEQKETMKKWVEQELFERYIILEYGQSEERNYQVYNGQRKRIC